MHFAYSFVKLHRHRQRSGLLRLQVKLPPATASLITQRQRHPVKHLAQEHKKRTFRLVLRTVPWRWTSSREDGNTLFKSFGL